MNFPKWFKAIAPLVIVGATLSSCAVSPEGPATSGASHGSLGSVDMRDYYYKSEAGWTYVYQNVQKIYNQFGLVSQTRTGANDTVRTMGFDGFEPSTGDSLFRYEISYRVKADYAGRLDMDMNYLPSTRSWLSHGAFVDGNANLNGMVTMQRRPRPVSTDTILAGIVGRIRTTADDFTNNGDYVWQKDTLWTTQHMDSVFVWERFNPGGPLMKSRCMFTKEFQLLNSWTYDVVNNPSTTSLQTVWPDMNMTVNGNSYSHVAMFRVYTAEVDDQDFNREYKYFACGTGPVYQYDWWYVTTDGSHFNKQDFTRTLLSVSHD